MNNTTAYTPLECLLLFQSLVAYGTEDKAFLRISDLLTNNALVKDGETYDAARLTSDALREIYLHLLRDELKSEEQEAQEDGNQTSSKKRKLQSPPFPSIKDAQEYKEKLPFFVERLYARYRDYMIHAIREDERRYVSIQKEIGEIERGEWDERILQEDKALANKNGITSPEDARVKTNGASSAEPQLDDKAVELPIAGQQTAEVVPNEIPPPAVQPPQPEARHEGLAISDVLNSQDTSRVSSPKIDQPHRNGAQSIPPAGHQRTGSNGPHGPSPLQSGQQQPGMAFKWEPPYQAGSPHQPPPYPPTGPYPQFNSPQYPPQPYPPPPRGSFSSPHGLPPPHPHVPSSPLNAQHPHPILLPPPNAARGSPGSPAMPLDALADIAGQQYRAPSGSPMMQQGPMQHGPPPPQGYMHPYPPQQRPPSGNGPPPQWNQPYIPPYQPQQFQYPPHPNQRPPYPPQPNLMQPENRQYNSPYNANQGPRPSIPPSQSQTPRSRPSLPNTPISQGLPRFMTGSGTRWTPTAVGATPRSQAPAERPAVEPISPILRPARLADTSTKKTTKKQTQKPEPSAKGKPGPKRGSQRTRAGSTASSVIAGSYRSQSVLSHADELSMDNEIANRHVKQEVATPVGVDDAGDTTADDLPTKLLPSPRQSMKRKRKDSILSPRSPKPSAPPTHVLWTRAFPKISASALESISGHRNASTFSAPVKERDAPGYKHLILRPQDLSSIRKAINSGHKAANAAAPADLNPSQSSAWLPISEDLIPPKGIINYSQLEKELMRMFANAIMFNADPDRGLGRRWDGARKGRDDIVGYEIEEDGVVKDTRAMFGEVEGWLAGLRAVEGREELTDAVGAGRLGISVGPSGRVGSSVVAEDDEVDELAGDGESNTGNVGGSVAKRRRKA